MYLVGFWVQKRIENVEDYLLAGRQLPVSLSTLTIIATWFGAESLMTTADEVSQHGIRRAMLDPVGISLCLLIAGLFVAGPMWRMNLLTVSDFFGRRFGKVAEVISCFILVPSYFGWVAAQLVALATVLEQFLGIPAPVGIIAVAVIGTGYTFLGGMWSVTWTDAIQMIFIVAGLVILGSEILLHLGNGDIAAGFERLRTGPPSSHWRLADDATMARDSLAALSAVAVGSLGNLPVQDLMQRIFCARSERVARLACVLAAVGYLAMGLLPIGAGLAAGLILPTVPEEGVITLIAQQVLSPLLLLVFLLAIVSAVLSTLVSAVMAPAAILAHNLIEPLIVKKYAVLESPGQLKLQRACVILVTSCSTVLALRGAQAYELVQDSYSMSLVGLFVPLAGGLWFARVPPVAAIASMLSGILCWTLHRLCGWDNFLQPWMENLVPIPHELVDAAVSAIAFMAMLLAYGNGASLADRICGGGHQVPRVTPESRTHLGLSRADSSDDEDSR